MTDRVFLMGDHHGDYRLVTQHARNLPKDGRCTIIHVGDGEEGYNGNDVEFFRILDAELRSLGVTYLSIHGNHSDPAMFDGRITHPNCKLLPDYTRLIFNKETWLLVGGAISFNRLDKVGSGTWWPEEEFVLDRARCERADVLVTHSGPSWIGPTQYNEFLKTYIREERELGIELGEELREERRQHDRLFELVQPSRWYMGHFHRNETIVHGGCKASILDIGAISEHPVF